MLRRQKGVIRANIELYNGHTDWQGTYYLFDVSKLHLIILWFAPLNQSRAAINLIIWCPNQMQFDNPKCSNRTNLWNVVLQTKVILRQPDKFKCTNFSRFLNEAGNSRIFEHSDSLISPDASNLLGFQLKMAGHQYYFPSLDWLSLTVINLTFHFCRKLTLNYRRKQH
jgi:hypothetical protein